MTKRIDLPESEIVSLYVDEHWTMSAIANRFGVSRACVRGNLVRLDIDIRPTKDYITVWDTVLTKEFLHKRYIDEGCSPRDISEETGARCNTVRAYLKRHGISMRIREVAAQIYVHVYAPGHPCAGKNGGALEHRMVYYDVHGEIPEGWVVHHINGIKHDNRVENLVAMPSKKHANLIPFLMNRIAELEGRVGILYPAPATEKEKRRYTAMLVDKYGEIELELGPGRIAKEHRRGHATIGLNPSADYFCDIYWNLENGIPLEDESVSSITSNQFLEHISRDRLIFLMNEFWRTLKPGGFMVHSVPIVTSPWAWADPTHRNFFQPNSFLYFSAREDGTPFVENFSDYGIRCAFKTSMKVRAGVDITVRMVK